MIGSAVVADFIGGPASGRRQVIDGEPWTYVFAVAPDFAQIWTEAEGGPSRPVPIRKAVYHRAGVRDDGRRVYAYDARLSTG